MDTLLNDIKAFCAAHSISHTRFGEMALNDKPFISQLEGGRRVWPETEDRVRSFMREYACADRAA